MRSSGPARRTFDDAAFRAALGSFGTGVSVMTTKVAGVPHGMTANAVTSVSVEPPLVLVCVAREALMAERVLEGNVFALSFLALDQSATALRFADPDRPEGDAGFLGVGVHDEATGAPVLDDSVGWVDCQLWSVADGGDHLVVLGEVVALGAGDTVPLLYFRGEFGAFLPPGATD